MTFTDDAGNAESLTSTATTPVAAQPADTPAVLLTASFANVPADHNGSNFTFQLSFSENVEAGYARIRDHAFTVTGATIDSASRITQGSNQRLERGGKPHRQRGNYHHPARDHRLRRQPRDLHR